jgi:hypothetical protein
MDDSEVDICFHFVSTSGVNTAKEETKRIRSGNMFPLCFLFPGARKISSRYCVSVRRALLDGPGTSMRTFPRSRSIGHAERWIRNAAHRPAPTIAGILQDALPDWQRSVSRGWPPGRHSFTAKTLKSENRRENPG